MDIRERVDTNISGNGKQLENKYIWLINIPGKLIVGWTNIV